MNRTAIVCTTIATLGLVAAAIALGPLNPPSGSVAGSSRTLQEIYDKIPATGAADGRIPIAPSSSAITISQPGSYVLTGNISALGGTPATITITSSNVTLDLNGYQVQFNGTGSPVMAIGPAVFNVTIRNGTISAGSVAVRVPNGTPVSNLLLEDLRCENQYIRGIDLGDSVNNPTVRRCSVLNLGTTYFIGGGGLPAFVGIASAGNYTRIEDCTVHRCGFAGSPTGSGTFVGISVVNTGDVRGCSVFPGPAPTLSTFGFSFGPEVVYRDNSTRQINGTGYIIGVNAGGNF
jgi:hypothetical protein